MPDSQKMPGFVKAYLCGAQIGACQVFAPEPMKRDHGGFAAKLGFSEHKFKNWGAQVALDDPQPESCSTINGCERFDDFSGRILASKGKIGIFGLRMGRQGRCIETHQSLQVCCNHRNCHLVDRSEGYDVYVAFLGCTGAFLRQTRSLSIQ